MVLFVGIFSYNLEQFLFWKRLEDFWLWTIFQTLAISMMLIWPLRKAKKVTKILIGIGTLILFYVLFAFIDESMLTGPGDRFVLSDPLSFLYYFLYNGFVFCPILLYFPFYLFGVVIGEILYEKSLNNETKIPDSEFSKKISLPIILLGCILIIISVFIPTDIFLINTLSWVVYSLGADLVLFFVLYIIEQSKYFKFKRSYRFFYYFSYYSLSAYLIQHFLFYAVYNRFTPLIGFLVSFLILFLFYVFLRIMHAKVGLYFSLKAQIARFSTYLSEKIIKQEIVKD
ncbi:MAG: membrane protein of unknown function [Promethearchaeota archaeon]|nr:MAG: membrane protein of unknown function [Candidatus Lokiarchaeota archaeon]